MTFQILSGSWIMFSCIIFIMFSTPMISLVKVYYKDRSKVSSENLETFYLLGTLKELKVIDSDAAQKLFKKTDRLFVML